MRRMRVSMPEVHEVVPEDRTCREDEWGWVELWDLAKLVETEDFILLQRFIRLGSQPKAMRGNWNKYFRYLRRPCVTNDSEAHFELRSLNVEHLYEGACEDCRCGDALTEHSLYRFVEKHPIRVSAGWAKEVIAELRKGVR